MNADRRKTDTDIMITEMWSFLLYKKGKKPLGDTDPGKRIKRGIWRDEGLDITEFTSRMRMGSVPEDALKILETGSLTVRKGLFRRKEEHLIATGPISIERDPDNADRDYRNRLMDAASSSEILYPYAAAYLISRVPEAVSAIRVERRPQLQTADISPKSVLEGHSIGSAGDSMEGLTKVSLHRKVDPSAALRTESGKKIRTLLDLLGHLMTCEKKELTELLSGGRLVDFASKGLSNPALATLLRDLSADPAGEVETPENFRTRLGRWCLESPMGDQIVDEIVAPLLSRLMSSSGGELHKLEEALETLMDPRSTSIITDMVFRAEPEKRQHLIRLLGRTGDRSAHSTLDRLARFSNVDEDRVSAREALAFMGFDVNTEET